MVQDVDQQQKHRRDEGNLPVRQETPLKRDEECDIQKQKIRRSHSQRLERHLPGYKIVCIILEGALMSEWSCIVFRSLPLETRRLGLLCPFNLLEEIPAVLRVLRRPDRLEDLKCMQEFRFCVFEPVLSTPNSSL